MLDYIKEPDNNFSMLFILGDSAHMGFSDSLWKKAFETISSCSSSIPVCYVIGNHDTLFGGLNLYQDYLCPPGSHDEKGRCLWKRIDNGNIHLLILDIEWDLRLYTPEQQAWLLEQLESISPDDWCIVMSHTFYYCSGSYQDGWAWYDNHQTIDKLTPLFEKYNVDLVLSGHKHQSELLQKNGVTYVVVGSFGGPPDSEREYISPASVWYRAGVYAFVDVMIDGDIATIVFRDYGDRELFRTTINRR
jgi:3',5'-cyclic AMP phosphodiesterase CpdA